VRIFPSLLVCFNCGFTEFVMSEEKRRQLLESWTFEDDRKYGT